MTIRDVMVKPDGSVIIYKKDEKERIPEKAMIIPLDRWAMYSAILWTGGLFLGGIIGFLICLFMGV